MRTTRAISVSSSRACRCGRSKKRRDVTVAAHRLRGRTAATRRPEIRPGRTNAIRPRTRPVRSRAPIALVPTRRPEGRANASGSPKWAAASRHSHTSTSVRVESSYSCSCCLTAESSRRSRTSTPHPAVSSCRRMCLSSCPHCPAAATRHSRTSNSRPAERSCTRCSYSCWSTAAPSRR